MGSDGGSPAIKRREIGLRTATLLVAASMVGSGVFTTTGFLLRDLDTALAVLVVWAFGGVLATFGALAYAELGAALPENGGEYALLSRIYHPALGFVAGWVSLIVGFSAPTAAAAMAFGAYAQQILPWAAPAPCATALILVLALVHAASTRLGAHVHDVLTGVNLLLIVLFVCGGLWQLPTLSLTGEAAAVPHVMPPLVRAGHAAVGLVYVSFSYSGWNAAVYVAGEVRQPSRTLPRALLLGAGGVTLLYVLLNAVFVASAPVQKLAGVLEVGHVAAAALFGNAFAVWVSGLIAIGLATSVSAALMAGPRVYERMGEDYPRLALLRQRRARGGPVRAIALQTALALGFALTSSFDALLTYMGFTLTLVSLLVVLGVFVLRRREPKLLRPYRTWGHPFTTAFVALLMLWMTAFTLWQRPLAATAGLATIASGAALYLVVSRSKRTAA